MLWLVIVIIAAAVYIIWRRRSIASFALKRVKFADPLIESVFVYPKAENLSREPSGAYISASHAAEITRPYGNVDNIMSGPPSTPDSPPKYGREDGVFGAV